MLLVAACAVGLGVRLQTVRSRGPAPAAPSGSSTRSGPGQGSAAPAVHRHRLGVTAAPAGAHVHVVGSDGSAHDGIAPFHATLPEGDTTITLTMKGYNDLVEHLSLTKRRSLTLYLDHRGQLLHELRTFHVGPAPKQVAFTPDGSELWVTDLGGTGVEVFDPTTGKKLGDVSLGHDESVEVIFSADGSTAYVSQMTTASAYRVDVASLKVTGHFTTTGSWSKGMALSPDGRTLYISNWVSDDVSVIDLRSGKETARIHTVDTPRGLALSPDGSRLYVAGFGTGELARIDLGTRTTKVVYTSGGAMRHLVADDAHGLLYADDMGTDSVYVMDFATEHVRKLASTDSHPNSMDLSPDGKVLFVSCRGHNNPRSYYLPGPDHGSVIAYDTATGTPVDALVGGNQTTGLDVSADGTLLAYSDFLDNRVTIERVPPFSTFATGHGGFYARHFAFLPT